MKKIGYHILCLLAIILVTSSSCKKESESIFDMFSDVSVTFHGNHPFSVVDYKQVNDGDSVYIDYTITSAKEDMYFIGIETVAGASNSASPQRSVSPITKDSERRSYSGVIKLKMQRDGKATYRIYAMNRQNVYIGDGYKKVTIEVAPSYHFVHNRRVYFPDAEGTRASFFSIHRDMAFSYTNGKANSADIDFGIWRRPDENPSRLGQFINNLYSLSHSSNPFPPYDINGWEQRATKFSAIKTNSANTFLYTLVSSSTIVSNAKNENPRFTVVEGTTSQNGLVAGSLVYFLTPEGKYGALYVNAVSTDYEGRQYMSISIKMQR